MSGLDIFNQFGFREIDKSGEHSYGRCPFCNSPDHFYINLTSENKTWDCKVCGRSGGFKSFIEQMVDFCGEQFHGTIAGKLSKHRGIGIETLSNVRVGYHPATKQYILPIFSMDGKSVISLKLYNLKTMRNAAGCVASMYGLWSQRINMAEDILVCEGEWDTLVVRELIEHLQIRKTVAVGVPGAGSFKATNVPIFAGKNVYLLYDNDKAGRDGAEKASRLLFPVARTLRSLAWPEGWKEGSDIRDVYGSYHHRAEDTWKQLMEWMEYVDSGAEVKGTPAAADVLGTGDPVPCAEVYKVFQKWLYLEDTSLIDVIFGTVLANRLPGDPLWMFIVAPPGGTKTEPLLSLSGCPRIETISSLTPAVLISGAVLQGGFDPSLVPKLDGKTLIIKDFTGVLNLPYMERDEIFGILRDAYDGECSKPFGNGIWRKYKSKFGILAAVTPIIEVFTEDHAALGERFLRWRNYIPEGARERKKIIERAWSNVGREEEMRKELSDMGTSVLSAKYDKVPTIPKPIMNRVIAMAQLVSTLRGTVVRDKYTRDIQHKSFIELGTRMSKQFHKLLLGTAQFKGKSVVTMDEYQEVIHTGRGSVTQRLFESLKYVYKNRKKGITLTDSSKDSGLPMNTCGMVLDNLVMLGALYKDNISSGNCTWGLKEETQELIEESKIFSHKPTGEKNGN